MKRIFSFLLLVLFLYGPSALSEFQHIEGPWFTGPLIAPDGHTIPPGHVSIEPYFFVTDNYDRYNDNWGIQNAPNLLNVSPELEVTLGMSDRTDFEFEVPYDFNSTKGGSASGWGDTELILGIQILEEILGSWMPDCRLTLSETFPAGKYDHLNPRKLGADAIGFGSYQTSLATNFEKLYSLKSGKFLKLYLSLAYTVLLSTHVNGFNTYGGGIGTHGRVNPGNNFTADFALEYTITQHWASALDVVLATNQMSTFKGFPGFLSPGIPAMVGNGNSANLNLAPAVEYNFSENVGLIAGIWFSVVGKNTPAFVSAVIAADFYI